MILVYYKEPNFSYERFSRIAQVSLHYGKDSSFRNIKAIILNFVFIVNAVQQLADLEQTV